MAAFMPGRWPASLLLVAGCLVSSGVGAQSLPSDAFLSHSAAERAQPGLLTAPMRALRVATLEWPYPTLAAGSAAGAPGDEAAFAYPAPLVMGAAQLPTRAPPILLAAHASDPADDAEAPAIFGPDPASDLAYAELALDIVLGLPGIDEETLAVPEDAPLAFGPDISGIDTQEAALSQVGPLIAAPLTLPEDSLLDADGTSLTESAEAEPLYRNPVVIFGTAGEMFPALAFEHTRLAALSQDVPLPVSAPPAQDRIDPTSASPAERLRLEGPLRARAEKCLAEAIYFESRGEPKRGQIAVAQVVVNRVFSGFYPNDICKAVYQNAHRRNACQFTFACDYVKDEVREPAMWVQAKEIASDMLDGKIWLDTVGRATHYHAYWVRPSWVREMRKLDKIGVHTFYRPRRWDG